MTIKKINSGYIEITTDMLDLNKEPVVILAKNGKYTDDGYLNNAMHISGLSVYQVRSIVAFVHWKYESTHFIDGGHVESTDLNELGSVISRVNSLIEYDSFKNHNHI